MMSRYGIAGSPFHLAKLVGPGVGVGVILRTHLALPLPEVHVGPVGFMTMTSFLVWDHSSVLLPAISLQSCPQIAPNLQLCRLLTSSEH